MKHLITAAVILLAGTISLNAQFKNPVLEKHSDDVSFYINFDEAQLAQLASGEDSPFRTQGTVDYVDGFSGKALRHGYLFFRGADNMDLTGSGTLIYWIAPEKEFKTPPADKKEPGFNAVCLSGGKYTYSLFSGKMGGQPWRKGPLNSYVQYAPKLKTQHVNCVEKKWYHISDWSPSDWKMFAVTWKPGSFTASVNGGPMNSSVLKVPMTGSSDEIRLGFSPKPMEAQMLMDEFVILKKALTEQELKEIYDLSIQQMKK